MADSAGLAEPPAEVPSIRKYVQVRRSSAGDSRLGRDAHAPAADRGLSNTVTAAVLVVIVGSTNSSMLCYFRALPLGRFHWLINLGEQDSI